MYLVYLKKARCSTTLVWESKTSHKPQWRSKGLRGSLKHASSNLICAVLVSEHVVGHFGLLPCKAVKAILSASKGNRGCISMAWGERGLLAVLALTHPSTLLCRCLPSLILREVSYPRTDILLSGAVLVWQ